VYGKLGLYFHNFFLGDLENIFLGKDKDKEREFESESTSTTITTTTKATLTSSSSLTITESIGTTGQTSKESTQETPPVEIKELTTKVEVPIDEDDLDGQPMQLNLLSSSYDSDKEEEEDDLDGLPLDGNEKKQKKEKNNSTLGATGGQTQTHKGGNSNTMEDDELDGAPLSTGVSTNWTVIPPPEPASGSSSSSSVSSSSMSSSSVPVSKSSEDDDLDGIPLP